MPGYAALILRKDLQRLALAGGLIPRSHEWFAGSEAIWNGQRRQWTFPNKAGPPATLTFGYISGPFDKFRYASSEYQYIAFDELTEFREDDYLFLFSRLRRVSRSACRSASARRATRATSATCGSSSGSSRAGGGSSPDATSSSPRGSPTTRRSAQTNIASRYVPAAAGAQAPDERRLERAGARHLPHRLAAVLRPCTRSRGARCGTAPTQAAAPDALLSRVKGLAAVQLELLDAAGHLLVAIPRACRRFVTIDPAGTSADKARESRGRRRAGRSCKSGTSRRGSWTASSSSASRSASGSASTAWSRSSARCHAHWLPQRIWIEDEKLGHAAVSILERRRAADRSRSARRAATSSRGPRADPENGAGEVFLPRYDNRWRPAFEAELLAWTGLESQPSDQIDAAAYAAIIASTTPRARSTSTPSCTAPKTFHPLSREHTCSRSSGAKSSITHRRAALLFDILVVSEVRSRLAIPSAARIGA